MDQYENHLTSSPVAKLIKEIAVPASVGFFFNTMYNVVDTFYGGKISTDALAALSLSFPVFFIIIAFGTGFSTGSTALVAHSLGAGKKDEAGHLAIQSIIFAALLSIVIMIAGLLFSPTLFTLLGASGEYLALALQYMNVIFWGTLFFMLVFGLNAVLNARGDTKSFRNFLIVGFFLNLILDPLFLYGGFGIPALGIAGVAWATVVIQLLGVIYLTHRVRKTSLFSGRTWRDFLPDMRAFKEISKQGVPASLNMVTIGLGIFIITYFISRFGSADVAAYGIATRVEQIFLLPTIGLTTAVLTLVGQNVGAGRFDRAREALRLCLRFGAYIMTAAAFFIFFFARHFMDAFTDDVTVIESGVTYLRFAATLTWAYAIMFINVSALQGMKKPMFALWVGLARQIVAPLILFTTLAYFFGIVGLWSAIVIINWGAAVVTIFYARRIFGRLTQEDAKMS